MGQAVEKNLAVTLLGNAVVEQDQNAAVGLAPYEPPETLLERDGRPWNLVIVKRISPRCPYALNARVDHRIARRRERQFIYDNAAQLFARHVHALPERGGGEKHAVGRRAELVEQGAARRRALKQRGVFDLERHLVVHHSHLLMAGEQDERPAPAVPQDAHDFLRRRLDERRTARLGKLLRHVEKRLLLVIEMAERTE